MDEIKELNDFERLCENIDILGRSDILKLIRLEAKIIKKLKAFEIIKKCCIVAKYPDDTYELAFCKKICIEKEEYDFLKEVL